MTTSRYKLILKTPSAWWGNLWKEALPSGNGKIGASVYGGVQNETILLNHSELWYGAKRDVLPDVSDHLAKVRGLMDGREYTKASWALSDALKEKGYDSRLGMPLPLADLKLSMPVRSGFRNYSRCLDMETGEVAVRWEDGGTAYERKLFVSRAEDTIVYEILSDGAPFDVEAVLNLHAFGDSAPVPNDKALIKSTVDENWLRSTMKVKSESEFLYYAVQNDDGKDFGAVMRVQYSGGKLESGMETVRVTAARKVMIFVKLFCKGERISDWKRLKEQLAGMNGTYQSMLEEHARIHKSLFHSASIILSDEDSRSNEELLLEAYQGNPSCALMEKMWSYGRYLLISATDQNGLPCPLYGLWCGDYNALWSQNVANENLEMIYWHTAVGGLSELLHSVFNYFGDLMGDSRENARKLFGCRGINIHGYTSPGMGLANVTVPVIMNWTGAAGWIARFYYDYYLYTGDREFLINTALPFMKEAVLFLEDFLVLGEDGYYIYYPSVSPENTPANFMPKDRKSLAHPLPTTINATMDFAIAKELLGNMIEGSRIAGVYKDEIEKWETMLRRIPPYQINQDGAVKEWMYPDFYDNYNHRHISHIYPVFPGQEITRESDPDLFRAYKAAVDKRLVVGLSAQTNWSLAHLASIYARLEYGDRALECLELLSRSCLSKNFFTLSNDWRNMGICLNFKNVPFQIDANMGWVNAVQEMLLYSSPHLVKILPACPAKWSKGSVKDLHFCTGRISFTWNDETGEFSAEISSDRDTEVLVMLPGRFCNYRWNDSETGISVEKTGDLSLKVRMDAGKVLIIHSARLIQS